MPKNIKNKLHSSFNKSKSNTVLESYFLIPLKQILNLGLFIRNISISYSTSDQYFDYYLIISNWIVLFTNKKIMKQIQHLINNQQSSLWLKINRGRKERARVFAFKDLPPVPKSKHKAYKCLITTLKMKALSTFTKIYVRSCCPVFLTEICNTCKK